jgi:uncharacterized protein YecE (DUF72 family)
MSALEINATFYGRQKPKSWEAWEKVAPDGFQFAVKGSRYCVMRSKLADAREGLEGFFAQGFSALGAKLGPILWQFTHYRRFDRDDIAGFIDLLPEKVEGLSLRHVIEPRHASCNDDKFFELCRARNVAVVFEDSDDYPCIEADTADFAYARLQRMSEDIDTGYDAGTLDEFAERVRKWLKRGDAYVFMINGAKVRAPAAALALQERLR